MKVKSNYVRSLVVGLLAILMLLVGFCIMPFNNTKTAKASAPSHGTNGTIFSLTTNIPNVTYDCVVIGSGQIYTYDIMPNLLVDYTLVRAEKRVPSSLVRIETLSNGIIRLSIPAQEQVDITFDIRVVLVKIIPLPTAPTKDGYTFVEWCLDEALTIPYDGREVTADLKLYAKFNINTYTVTFDSSGGSAVESQVVDWNALATLTTPTRTGYDFVGWFIGETQYTDGGIKANTALTAKWKIKVFTVTFMVDNAVYKTLEVDYGTTFARALQVANLAYFKAVNSSGESLSNTTVIEENTVLSVVAMTQNEKVAMFLSENIWILWTAGISLIVCIILIALLVSKKRG